MTERPASTPGVLALIGRMPLFQQLGEEQLKDLMCHCAVVQLPPAHTLLSAGQINRHMYVVLKGQLRVHLGVPDSEPIARVQAGEVVGELSTIDQRPTSAYVVSDQHSEVLKVSEQGFWNLVAASHHFAVRLMHKLAERLRANNSAVIEHNQRREAFEQAALTDALTSIYNRRWLDETLPRLVTRHRHGARPLTVAMVDVDHFKRFNDDHGHKAGDVVLQAVAKTLQERLRPTDYVARYGGEEFAVILPDTDLPGAYCAAERLRRSIAGLSLSDPAGNPLPAVTISLGLCSLHGLDNSHDLLQACDDALYRAKRNGRNRAECAPTGADVLLEPQGALLLDDNSR